jgi:hypothetical protein
MKPRGLVLGLLFASLCLLLGPLHFPPVILGHQPFDRRNTIEKVRPGMAADAVRQLLGQPNRIARQILYRRFLEQWIYDEPAGLWIEWDCLKGQEPRVLTVHVPGLAKL